MKNISQRSSSTSSFSPSSILLLFFLPVVIFLASSPRPVSSFTCAKYTSSVQLNEKAFPYNSDYTSKRTYFGAPASCDALLRDKVFFVPQNGIEKEDVEQQAFSSGFGLGALEDECRIPATRYLCAFAFRRCELQPFSPSLPNFLVVPLPRPPSRSLCEDFVKGCEKTGLSLPNCTSIDPSTGLPVYPKREATFIVPGVGTFEIPSEDYSEVPDLKKHRLEPAVCPFPLELRKGHSPTCQIVCPHGNQYTRDEWSKINPIRFSFSIISFVVVLWTLITLLTIKERRGFPANLAITSCVIHSVWMVFFMVGGAIGLDNYNCNNKWEAADSRGNPSWMCGVEAFWIFYSTLMLCIIWSVIGISLFLVVVLERRPKDLSLLKYPSYLIAFTVPTVFAITLWAGGWLGYGLGLPWCWIDSDEFSVGFYWTWIMFLFFIVFFCVVTSLIKMMMVKRKLMSLRRAFLKHVNILVFCTGFTLVYGWHWGVYLYLRANRDNFNEAYADWVACNSATGGQNNCHLKEGFSIAKLYFQTGLTAGSGLFIFLAWGCSPRYIRHWRNLLKLIFTGRFREIPELTLGVSIVDTSGSTRSGGSKHSGKAKSSLDTNTERTEKSPRQ